MSLPSGTGLARALTRKAVYAQHSLAVKWRGSRPGGASVEFALWGLFLYRIGSEERSEAMQVDDNITAIAQALNLKSWDQVSGALNAFLWVPSILGQRAHLAWTALRSATRHSSSASGQSDFKFTDVARGIPVVSAPHVNVEAASADVAPDDAWPKNTTCVATEQPCSRQKEVAAGNDQSYVGTGAENPPDATQVPSTNSGRIDVPHHPAPTSETTTLELLTDDSAPGSSTRYSRQQQGHGLQLPMPPLQSTFEAADPNNRPTTLTWRFFDETRVLDGPATLEVHNAAP